MYVCMYVHVYIYIYYQQEPRVESLKKKKLWAGADKARKELEREREVEANFNATYPQGYSTPTNVHPTGTQFPCFPGTKVRILTETGAARRPVPR
jgi:hypothetical protein